MTRLKHYIHKKGITVANIQQSFQETKTIFFRKNSRKQNILEETHWRD